MNILRHTSFRRLKKMHGGRGDMVSYSNAKEVGDVYRNGMHITIPKQRATYKLHDGGTVTCYG